MKKLLLFLSLIVLAASTSFAADSNMVRSHARRAAKAKARCEALVDKEKVEECLQKLVDEKEAIRKKEKEAQGSK